MFDFQVERPVRFIQDSTLSFVPVERGGRETMKVVIDTSGRVVISSVQLLKTYSDAAKDSIVAELPRWRFEPATARGAKACQLVQVSIGRKRLTK